MPTDRYASRPVRLDVPWSTALIVERVADEEGRLAADVYVDLVAAGLSTTADGARFRADLVDSRYRAGAHLIVATMFAFVAVLALADRGVMAAAAAGLFHVTYAGLFAVNLSAYRTARASLERLYQ